EVCDGVDNNCDNSVDNVLGVDANCMDPSNSAIKTLGQCVAKYACAKDLSGNVINNPSGPGGLTCTQVTPPSPELCNGLDDDCAGKTDNNLADPTVGVVGGPPCMGLTAQELSSFPTANLATPPCNPGITVCVDGAVVCQGRVGPVANQC